MTWDNDDGWDEPVASTTDYCKPQDLDGHLLIIWALGYVPHIQTRFTRPDKKSDAIAVDVVDLDAFEEDGSHGKLFRNSNWMQSKLIRDLKPKIGKRLLGRMGQGVASNGMNAPWELTSELGVPGAMERAEAWMKAHPDFRPTEFMVKEPWEQRQQPAQPQQREIRPQPGWSREDPAMYEPRQNPDAYEPREERPPAPRPPAAGVAGAEVTPEELSMLQQMRRKREEDARRQAHADRLYPERQEYGY